MPVRAFGTFCCKISDHAALIDKVAGIKRQFTVDDVQERVISMLDQLLMKWIVKEGKDMFNLQANSFDIGKGIQEDLDISTSSMHSMAGSLYVTSRKQQDFRQQLLSSMFLLQVQQSDFR